MQIILESEFQPIKQIINDRFKIYDNCYWYPLSGKIIDDDIIVLNLSKLINSKYKNIIENEIRNINTTFYVQWEYKIKGSRYWKIRTNEFDIDTYSEKYVFTNNLDCMIYFSHEDSISFVGNQLISILKKTMICLTEFNW